MCIKRQAIIRQLLDGLEIDQHLMKFENIRVEDLDGEQRNKWVHVTLLEGRNREVRKLWEAVDCQVSRLTRVRYDFLTLPRNLRQGKYRDLTAKEVKRLSGA
jgi:23S rRNA pseudouridine2605 synthase